MKAILTVLSAVIALPVQAQLFGPEALGGAVLGGVAGGVIGHNNGRKTAEGAAIGAGAGLVLGAVVGQGRRLSQYEATQVPQATPGPVYAAPAASAGPNPGYWLGGAALGGVAGAVIGHNSGRHAGEGALIGAGAGLLLGGLLDNQRRLNALQAQRPAYAGPYAYYATAPAAGAPASQASQVTIINNYYAPAPSPMAPATALFGRQ